MDGLAASAAGAPNGPGTGVHPTRWPARAGLVVLLAVTAVSYTWAIQRAALFTYYAAAVRSMSASGTAFLFGGFDPGGWVTVDKLPGGFWIQAAAVRLFGYSIYALVLPQVLAGLATLVVTFAMASRCAGDVAGLLAAAVVAVTPVSTGLSRGNVPDAWSTLLLVLAADAVLRAVANGRRRPLVAAAVYLGLAFQVKMALVWLILVALGAGYLMAAPDGARRRLSRLAGFGLGALALSLSWIALLALVPAGRRPWFDGSRNNSVFEQVFLYNGFGRIQNSPTFGLTTNAHAGIPGAVLMRSAAPLTDPASVASAAAPVDGTRLVSIAPSWSRLLYGSYALGVAWLIPLAFAAGAYLLWETRRRPRTDLLRAGTVVWLVWLVTHIAVFSTINHLNAYYCAALVPAVGALIGSGAVHAWRAGPTTRWALPLVLAAGTAFDSLLLDAAGPRWQYLRLPLWGLTGLAALLLTLRPAHQVIARSAAVLAVSAMLFVPTIGSVAMDTHDGGPYTLGFSQKSVGPARQPTGMSLSRRFGGGEFTRLLQRVEPDSGSREYLLATFGSPAAAPYIAATGAKVLPIGGYTGLMPFPTLRQLQDLVRGGQVRYISAPPHRGDQRQKWVVRTCALLPGYGIDNQGGQVPAQLYDCRTA